MCLLGGLSLTLVYSWLLDDAYIYFKYVDNWVLLGRGLVYNPGEHAEGFTSPLWLLILAALRRAGLGYWTIVRGAGLLSFAAFWWAAILVDRRLAQGASLATPRFNAPLLLLSVNYGFLSYFTSGTESPLVALAAMAYALCLAGSTSRVAQVAVGLSPLVRPELGLAWLLAIAWLRWNRGRTPWLVVTSGVAANGAWLLFRALYYADLFPTTFYLKWRASPTQGFLYLHDTFGPYAFYFWAPIGLFYLFVAWMIGFEGSGPRRIRLAMLGIAAAMTAYVVAIGGDARHFRYLAFPIVLGMFAFAAPPEGKSGAARARPLRYAMPIVAFLLALQAASAHPHQLSEHPLRHLLIGRDIAAPKLAIVDGIADADHHRFHAELPALSPWGTGDAIELRPLYETWRRGGGADPPTTTNAEYLCWYHYRHFDQWSVHGFGLTDMILARTRGDARPDDRPGHRMALLDRAREEAAIVARRGLPPRAGVHRSAVEAGTAPPWVRANLPVIEGLEKKVYGPRDAWESLRLATDVGGRIDLDAAPPAAPATAR